MAASMGWSTSRGTSRLPAIGASLCAAGGALALLALVGWISRAAVLTYLVRGHPPMAPNTAIGALLVAVGALVSWREQRPRWAVVVCLVAGAAAVAIGVMSVAEYVFDESFGTDNLLFRMALFFPGRLSLPTALGMLLLGSALVTFDVRPVGGARPAEWLALAAGLIGLLTLLGHAHTAPAVYHLAGSPEVSAALPTSVALLLIATGLLLERPRVGLMGLATSTGPGGTLSRRLGLGVILAPPLVGVAAGYVFRAVGLDDVPVALALLTTLLVPFGIVILFVTASKLDRAHRALEVAGERIHTLVDQASDGIFVADVQGRYTDVNAAGRRMLGYAREEIVGKTIIDLLPPEDAERLWSQRQRLLAGRTEVGEWQLRHRNGHYVPVEVSAKILADGRWQGLVRDITLRKAVEREAERSRARLDGIVSIASDAIVSIDAQQRVVLYNQGAQEVFGWSAEEVVGNPLEMLIPERFRQAHAVHVARFAGDPRRARKLSGGPPVIGLRRNGEEFAAEAAISKVQIEGDTFFTVVMRDVSERVALEREVREARDFLDNLLQSSVDYSILALDLQRRVILWNEGARRHHGYTPAEIEGQPIDVLHAADDLASGAVHAVYAAALDRGSAEAVLPLLRKGGSQFVAEVAVTRRVDRAGKPIGFLVVSHDVSAERQRADHERLLGEAGVTLASTLDPHQLVDRFAALVVRSVVDGCLVQLVDGAGTPRWRTIALRDRAKVALARSLEILNLDPARPGLDWAALQRRRSALISHVSADYLESIAQSPEHLRLLRELAPVSFAAVPITVRDELLGAVVFLSHTPGRSLEANDLGRAEDLVRRLALALDNARLYQAAQEAIAGRDEVLRIVAHDLRSPLTTARLAADLLISRPPAEERRKPAQVAVQRIRRSLERASHLIDDLLDISQIEAGRLTIDAKPSSPVELAQEVVESLAATATERSLALELELDGELPPIVADPGRIQQVLVNLVGNALKFVPPGGHVRLRVKNQVPEVQFSVSDDGPGIPAEHVGHVFDRFWQGKSSDRRGAGLGLAIAKLLVEAHGAELSVQSEAGKGSTFSFALRSALPPATPAVAATPARP
jgi:PAS domain S-box-containing protein